MKPNIRSRNIEVNTYVGMLIVTIVSSLAALFILHIAIEVPFATFASASAYDIGSMR
jgi:hypothetical protein